MHYCLILNGLYKKKNIMIFGQILIIQSTVHSDRNVLWLLSFYAKNINALNLWAYVQNGKAIERCVFQKPFFPNDFLVKWKPISLDLRDQTLKFIYAEKATIFWEISTVYLTITT
jgi:hypothetical protein